MTQNTLWGWFVNDLHRHPIPYYFIRYYVKTMRYNRLILNDAPLSVARSFIKQDWQKIIHQSSIPQDKISLTWYWPFRYGVTYAANANF